MRTYHPIFNIPGKNQAPDFNLACCAVLTCKTETDGFLGVALPAVPGLEMWATNRENHMPNLIVLIFLPSVRGNLKSESEFRVAERVIIWFPVKPHWAGSGPQHRKTMVLLEWLQRTLGRSWEGWSTSPAMTGGERWGCPAWRGESSSLLHCSLSST